MIREKTKGIWRFFMKMTSIQKSAFRLILFLGIVSLLGDIIYEGSRGVIGQYFNILGVNAATVGIVVGLGELLGYLFRLASGIFADKSRSYWLFTTIGYLLLASIPLISLTGIWQIVALFVIVERIGKGIRTPARDTIASHAARQVGTGVGFGIAEFMDQIGAVLGPLVFAFVFAKAATQGNLVTSYQNGYRLFWIPFSLLMLMLLFTYKRFKKPEELEVEKLATSHQKREDNGHLPKSFWLYVFFVFITTAGFISFALVGFHLKRLGIMNDSSIALLYALAMGIDAIFALVAGRIYDLLKTTANGIQREFFVLLSIPLLGAFVPVFVFSSKLTLIISGIVLFGIVVGIQETILKAAVADMIPIRRRSTAYGIFHVSFGLAFFLGSSFAGFLYDYSIPILIFSLTVIEFMAIPVFYKMIQASKVFRTK
jgi:MFS family permease